jgi:DNA modification methylase
MNELTITQSNIPANVEDLSKFVLVGVEKLKAVKAEITAIKKLGLAKEVHEQKLKEAQNINDAVQLASVQIGKLLNAMPKATKNNNPSGKAKETTQNRSVSNLGKPNSESNDGDRQSEDSKKQPQSKKSKTKAEAVKELGFSRDQVSQFQQMANNEKIVKEALAEAKDKGDIASRSAILKKIKQEKKKEEVKQAKEKIAEEYKHNEEKATIRLGDSLTYSADKSYNLLLTDPPYSTDVEDIDSFANTWLPNALKGVRDDGFAYVFIGAYPNELKAYLNVEPPSHIKLEQVLVWTYKNTLGNNPKDRYKQNYQACLFYRGVNAPNLDCPITNEQWAVQEINAPDGRIGDRYHAWQKPMEIAERFIRHSTKAGDMVYDPFACTGTFLLAATKLGRKAFGFEINKENADIAIERGCVYG